MIVVSAKYKRRKAKQGSLHACRGARGVIRPGVMLYHQIKCLAQGHTRTHMHTHTERERGEGGETIRGA